MPIAEPETSTRGRCGDPARASHKRLVPKTRLSRILRFFSAVQRPTIDSPAKCTTASKPETEGAGLEKSHTIWFGLEVPRRTRRTTSYPSRCKTGIRALPIKPEEPLTRTRAGDIGGTKFSR